MRVLLIDNYDSYTHNLAHLAGGVLGTEPTVVSNDAPELTPDFAAGFDALLISPGPGRPQQPRDVGATLAVLAAVDLPVLGVCLGHQALAWLAGGEVKPAPAPAHGRLDAVRHAGRGLFAGLPQDFTVVRYHSLCVSGLEGTGFEVDAWTPDGVVMGLRHRSRPWWGLQFHPESVASQHGRRLMEAFADQVTGRRRRPPRPAAPVPRPAPRTGPPEHTRWTVTARRVETAGSLPAAFERLFGGARYAFWLDSARTEATDARYSFIGAAVGEHAEVLRYRVGEGRVSVLDADGTVVAVEPGGIFDVLDARLAGTRLDGHRGLPLPFTGGYVGYLGYEARADCGVRVDRTARTPDAVWLTATRMVALDHRTGAAWLIALSRTGDSRDATAARRWVDEAAEVLPGLAETPVPPVHTPDLSRAVGRTPGEYADEVRECLRELRAGESYEICLTAEAAVPYDGDLFALYRAQRQANPAPYAAFLRLGGLTVLSSSPERFLRVDADGVAESKPIKGTAPRADDPEVDAALCRWLAESPKTRAENLMIVDLVRNDLGRVCTLGSVTVPRFMAVESYATVHQLVSTVRGVLRPGVGAVQAARACFPGGSMTGAPKARTMEIIDRLERRPRGVYSGALGYFSFLGKADLSIVIRTAVAQDGVVSVGAGGAIVLDSDPDDEHAEMMLKMAAALPSGTWAHDQAAERMSPT
ncbi:aminodeoxychorismate synthase component I [Micromonospora sp. KC207]|uniref:aminodeoxychorismate synthase component I n=1 Tax=Micromonospora sp. KC207 TaxID=2530377 RepID=UPI001048B825|nr:aminodeoxychorismate synthase component I [Micromonospora sp. KC207]TDC59570.1 aminodeoxychorismate synthase component I [Micromonospora sp. KC207]